MRAVVVGWIAGSAVTVAALVHAAPALAQVEDELEIPAVEYPRLPARAAVTADFAPPGWTVEAEARGDLNKDGISDIVFVLHDADPRNVVANQGLGTPTFDTNPRILAAAFGSRGDYRLALENHALIPRLDSPTIDDPFDKDGGLTMRRGTFALELGYFASAGSWETSRTKLTFRHQHGRFELIGFDRTETQRNSGEVTRMSANYLTGRLEIATGSIETDVEKLRVRKLPKRQAPAIEEIGSGLEFDPLR